MRHQVFRFLAAFSTITALAGTVSVGCSDDHGDDHGAHLAFCDLPTVCREIVIACHSKDDATNAEIHECHETGHDVGTAAACGPVHDDCIGTCNAAPDIGTPEPLENCNGGDAATD